MVKKFDKFSGHIKMRFRSSFEDIKVNTVFVKSLLRVSAVRRQKCRNVISFNFHPRNYSKNLKLKRLRSRNSLTRFVMIVPFAFLEPLPANAVCGLLVYHINLKSGNPVIKS